jgi:hypothetical protein
LELAKNVKNLQGNGGLDEGYKSTEQVVLYCTHEETNRTLLNEACSSCKVLGFHSGDYEECRLLDIRTQFIPHRKHITSPLEGPVGY